MIWLLALVDLVAGAYLLGWALRRERRDKPGVLAVGAVLLLCSLMLVGLGAWRLAQGGQPPSRPGAPTTLA